MSRRSTRSVTRHTRQDNIEGNGSSEDEPQHTDVEARYHVAGDETSGSGQRKTTLGALLSWGNPRTMIWASELADNQTMRDIASHVGNGKADSSAIVSCETRRGEGIRTH